MITAVVALAAAVLGFAASVSLLTGGSRTAELAAPPERAAPAPAVEDAPPAARSRSTTCSDVVRSARQGSGAEQATALLRSLDACSSLDAWSAAVADDSVSQDAARSEVLELCGGSSSEVQRTLTCADAIGAGLVAAPASSSNETAGPSTDGVLVGRQRGVSAEENGLLMRWDLIDGSGMPTEPVPFTYRIVGPIAATVEGVAPAGATGPVAVPGWEPGVTIRVELTSTTEPVVVYSAPLTHDGI